ncbi:hypothetical protein H0H92_015565, partial [Tricholoma furcatifolium]
MEEAKWAPSIGEQYRWANKDEISEPSEFEYSRQANTEDGETSPLRLTIHDETEDHIRALREKNGEKPPRNIVEKEKPRLSWEEKGKWRENNPSLSEADIPRLRQQWCDKYADIVNGTKEELPPWRE